MKMNLRKLEESDLESIVKYANNKAISDNLTNAFPYPYTESDGKKFIEKVRGDNPTKVFAIVIDGEACGCIGIFPQQDVHKKSAEIGYWLAEKHWGKRVMTQAIKKIIKYGFETWDVVKIYAKPFSYNIASQKALTKSGMKLEAKLKNAIYKNGQLHDEYIYSILL